MTAGRLARAGPDIFGVVDVGGTKIMAGLASATEILVTRRLSTDALRGPDNIVDRIAGALAELGRAAGLPEMSAVGLSVPGPLDRRRGLVALHAQPALAELSGGSGPPRPARRRSGRD